AGWTSTPWVAGGATTVTNGSAVVDGARLSTTGFYSPNHVLEFVATFQPGVPNQHIGFGTTLNSTPWAIYSTGGDGASLRARTHTGSVAPTAELGASWLGGPHLFRIEWTASQVIYSIDGAVVATHNAAITGQMRPLASDSAAGSGTLVIDWMRLSPYQPSGSFTSRVLDAGGAATWTSASWTANTPAGTTLAVSVRSGTTPVPDGSWSVFSAVSGNGASIANTGRYVQYRLDLSTTVPGVTPSLRDIILTYQNIVVTAPTVVSVTPDTGPATGGSGVTIVGTGFSAGATVSFGGVAAASVIVVSGTEITAVTPEHPAGTVDVTVTNTDDATGALPGGFTYEAP
ncbi:MAG TPA: IPT/TIG domain-containing protein, partial [Thermomicrobiales bacterium]|nr:IPT/TIG domain-containing protein [Thermomicrobiales bacterium]